MPTKRTSGNELGVSAGAAAAAAARRKPASTARKPRVISQAQPSAILTASRRGKTSAAHPAASAAGTPTVEQIAHLAYAIWEARGGQGGSPEEDWLAAERQLRAGK
jgi:hypothetical protein